MLAVLRFFTGIGIGTLMPATVALSSDYAPERMRAVVIMLVFAGEPIGGFLGGQLIAQMLPIFGWTSIFVVGGVLPLALIPVQLIWLPESPRFLLRRRQPVSPSAQRVFRTLDIEPTTRGHAVDVADRQSRRRPVPRRPGADHAAGLDAVLRQSAEHVPDQLLAADRAASVRLHRAGAVFAGQHAIRRRHHRHVDAGGIQPALRRLAGDFAQPGGGRADDRRDRAG